MTETAIFALGLIVGSPVLLVVIWVNCTSWKLRRRRRK